MCQKKVINREKHSLYNTFAKVGAVMKGRHVIGLSLVLIVSCIGIRACYATLFAMHNLVFCIDDQITLTEKYALMNFIHALHEHTTHVSDTILPIQQQFPFVTSIAITRLPNNILQYTIHTAEPCCIVNQELAFTKNNTLVHRNIFTPTALQNLPTMLVDEVALQKEHGLDRFQQCVAELPRDLFADYKIAWFNPMHLRLYTKNQSDFSIIFSVDHLPDERTITACTSIKQSLPPAKKNRYEKKGQSNTSNWAADIRFNNQIVLYAEKGDGGTWLK